MLQPMASPDPSAAPSPRPREVPGWLTDDQAATLRSAAATVPPGGCVVEVGSHQGRSTVVLADAVPADGTVVAVDPFVRDWRYGAPDTEARLRAHLAERGLTERVDVRVTTSEAALATWDGPVDLVYVDGKHDYWSTCHDLGWSRWLPRGGTLLVHDSFSSLGVTLALLRTLATSRRLAYRGRIGSLARLEVTAPTPADRARVLGELPWFGRNLVVKVLLRLRARRLAGWLGHHGAADPF